ncbi:MAG: DUF1338 domain-containing protein [Bacteroidota bacterium]
MELKEMLENLWKDYTKINSSAEKIRHLFETRGENVVNDHIAFRTFNDPAINIDVLSGYFTEKGYAEKGQYTFEQKHLSARHYEHEYPEMPLIFISQLILEDFSDNLQSVVRDKISNLPEGLTSKKDFLYSGNSWGKPSYQVYNNLRTESEYAAWLYVFGFRANHFTVSIDRLKTFDTINEVNQFLKDNGFQLNDSGGEVKGSSVQLLEQSSTKADIVPVEFIEGTYEIPGCYYEFAKRYKDENGELFTGFISKSADKIFESTDYYKKN